VPRAALFPPIVALALAVGACASIPSAPPPAAALAVDLPFAIEGRLSARRGADAIAVAFAWTHASPKDAFVVQTPLGQTVAEITSDASVPQAELRTADGRRDVAGDWATLAERAVGFPLPVAGLVWWAQGAPRAGAAHTLEVDRAGRPGVLRQDGCEIVYAYPDELARRPSRLELACHDLAVRIVIDRWRDS
jgi:outer membrane lipoprotein LolB